MYPSKIGRATPDESNATLHYGPEWAWPKLTVVPLVPVEEQLTPQQVFRLIEIAHETRDPEIRNAAMRAVHEALNPLMATPLVAG